MAEEILNKKIGDALVTSQVVSTQPTPRKRGRKPGPQKKQAQPSSAAQRSPAKENGHQPIWLSTVVNLVLLIAIFTIILATHRAIQNSRQTAPKVVATETVENVAIAATEEPAPAEEIKQEEVEPAKAEEVVVAQEEKTEPAKAEPACDPDTLQKLKEIVAKKSVKKTPFADLDLSKNPWNGGGEQDLDNDKIRQEYTKKNYLSSAEPASE